jgi:hypothetical protein
MKILDLDGTLVDCYEDNFINKIGNEIKKAIYRFKQGGYNFKSEQDTFQNTMIWIWKNLPKYDVNRNCKLSSFIYLLIRTSLLQKSNIINPKDPFEPLNDSYREIWKTISGNDHNCTRRLIDILPDARKENNVRYVGEIKDIISHLFRNSLTKNRFSKLYETLELLIKHKGNKKVVAEKMDITIVRVNQIISKIKMLPEFQEYCYN